MMVPATNACLKLLRKENIVTGRKAKTEKGQPIITPLAETATAKAGFSRRANADASDIAYIENELGKKPEIKFPNYKTHFAEVKTKAS